MSLVRVLPGRAVAVVQAGLPALVGAAELRQLAVAGAGALQHPAVVVPRAPAVRGAGELARPAVAEGAGWWAAEQSAGMRQSAATRWRR